MPGRSIRPCATSGVRPCAVLIKTIAVTIILRFIICRTRFDLALLPGRLAKKPRPEASTSGQVNGRLSAGSALCGRVDTIPLQEGPMRNGLELITTPLFHHRQILSPGADLQP